MIDKNNVWLQKILPLFKVGNWLIKKGLLIYFTILCALSYGGNLQGVTEFFIAPENYNISLKICLGELAWVPCASYLLCFLLWGLFLYQTWWGKITWKSLLPHILIFFLIKYSFIIINDLVFYLCSD